MVLKHNKRPFGGEESCQPASKHNIRRLNFGPLASFVGISSFTSTPEDFPISDERRKEAATQLRGESKVGGYAHVTWPAVKEEELKTPGFAVVPNDHSSNGYFNTSNLVGGNNCNVLRPEYGRQTLCEDKCFQLGYTHTKQFDHDCRLHLFSEILPFNSIHEEPLVSALSVAACQEMPADDTNSSSPPSLSWHTCNAYEEAINLESPVGAFSSLILKMTTEDTPVWRPDEFKNYLGNSDDSEDMPADDNPSSTLSLSWNTSNTFEEDTRLESPVGASFIPYYEDDCQIVGDNPLEETSSSAFDYPHRKPVAIGPDYQADIPVLRLGEFENSVGNNEDSNDKWIGTCILPMPVYETLPLEVKVRHCKNMCNCLDQGSIRCVRQHIVESREKLEQEMGHEKFMMLGFGDMGEVVAQNWSAEEEQAFQKVVLANPASLDKNFWDDLHHVFILRSTKELVSYYFNVFMLRKRAEQNRMDPMNADSDNDEWQESDESVSDDGLEDSLVECPNDGDDVPYNDDDSTDILEETGDLYACNGTGPVAVENDGPYDVPEDCNINKLKSMSDGHSSDKNLQ
ncbi:hypothetical protein J5N97_010273 [Dioscorea zingiberensis]|uniref:ELM2 domain-containing protein n=1 Tax=Dioscorea zingiberensis TaxID=325984 RepID=A0A9D5CZ32_9LILI|nr:hypothetical protein J5N97_010273 [Dioscorea zingiberensis]